MALDDMKIVASDYVGKDVTSAPDILRGDARTNKEIFDRLVKEVVAPKHNGLIDTIKAEQGSAMGSYVGNGSGNRRTVDTGTKSNVAVVYTAAQTIALVYPFGAVSLGKEVYVAPPTTIKFENGVFTIQHPTPFNYPNYTYNYYVL
jgi:hypothetical protein